MKTVTFNKVFFTPGSIHITTPFTLQYREWASSTWTVIDTGILVDVDGTILDSPLPSVSLDETKTYIVRAIDELCSSYYDQQLIFDEQEDTFYWIEDDSYCEQENPLNLISSITGFADPRDSGYDSVTGRVYVVDASAITSGSNIYWFNPDTITSETDVTPVGSIDVFAVASIMDMADRKIYISGSDTGGLIRYDIATDMVDTLAYGTDAVYNRLYLFRVSDTILLSLDTEEDKIYFLDIESFSVSSSIDVASIPSANKYISTGSYFVLINGQYWVLQSQGPSSIFYDSSIAVYSEDFSTLVEEIALPDQDKWDNNSYWRSIYLDGDNFLVYDFGSNQLIKVDINTHAVTLVHQFNNRQGKTNSSLSITRDAVSEELFISGDYRNTSTDSTAIPISYKLDDVTYEPIAIYPDIAYGYSLPRAGLADTLIGTYVGSRLVYPDNPPGAATDGIINIFSKSGSGENTGRKIVLTLQEINASTSEPTGAVKINVSSDPDYIAPYVDLTNCPIVYTVTCPEIVYTITGSDAEYEYSLAYSTYANPSISRIELRQIDTVTSDILNTITISKNLYQNGTVTKIGGNPNQVDLLFIATSEAVLETCEDIFTIS